MKQLLLSSHCHGATREVSKVPCLTVCDIKLLQHWACNQPRLLNILLLFVTVSIENLLLDSCPCAHGQYFLPKATTHSPATGVLFCKSYRFYNVCFMNFMTPFKEGFCTKYRCASPGSHDGAGCSEQFWLFGSNSTTDSAGEFSGGWHLRVAWQRGKQPKDTNWP